MSAIGEATVKAVLEPILRHHFPDADCAVTAGYDVAFKMFRIAVALDFGDSEPLAITDGIAEFELYRSRDPAALVVAVQQRIMDEAFKATGRKPCPEAGSPN